MNTQHLVLADQPHGLFAVYGDQPGGAIWVLDWHGRRYGQSRAIRIRGTAGNVGYDDNQWLRLADVAGRNPDDPDDIRHWEFRVGWRHRWTRTYSDGWYDQTRCTRIEPTEQGQVEEWLKAALDLPRRPVSPAMDPVEQLDPRLRRLLGLEGPPASDDSR
ncbi:MAG: hypothetical protein QM779_13840 [Propionicimonas sp.]|uniref:hypothetical protein n=1 Tax=Propionicimonas sp. TaxID=1955623 RepID=UPI003D09823E